LRHACRGKQGGWRRRLCTLKSDSTRAMVVLPALMRWGLGQVAEMAVGGQRLWWAGVGGIARAA
jgi:hypothetical protein